MIGMVVCQNHSVQAADPMSGECRAQYGGIRSGVDKNRRGLVSHQDGVTLAHIQHHERGVCSRPGRDRCEKEQSGRDARDHPSLPSGSRQGPPRPHAPRCPERYTSDSSRLRVEADRGTG